MKPDTHKSCYHISELCETEFFLERAEAAAIVVFNLIGSVVDQIVFCKNTIDNERILQAGIDAVYKFLME